MAVEVSRWCQARRCMLTAKPTHTKMATGECSAREWLTSPVPCIHTRPRSQPGEHPPTLAYTRDCPIDPNRRCGVNSTRPCRDVRNNYSRHQLYHHSDGINPPYSSMLAVGGADRTHDHSACKPCVFDSRHNRIASDNAQFNIPSPFDKTPRAFRATYILG